MKNRDYFLRSITLRIKFSIRYLMYKIRVSQLTPKVSDFYIRHELYSLIQNELVIMIYLKQSCLM